MKIVKKQICSNLPDVKFDAACKKPEFTLRAEGDGEGCLPEVYTNTKWTDNKKLFIIYADWQRLLLKQQTSYSMGKNGNAFHVLFFTFPNKQIFHLKLISGTFEQFIPYI